MLRSNKQAQGLDTVDQTLRFALLGRCLSALTSRYRPGKPVAW